MSCILLRGAHIITMSPDRPDAEVVDMLVEDDRIAAIGERLDRPDAEVVDVSGRIIIPGLVNAHLHTWQSALRCVWPLRRAPGHRATPPSRDASVALG